MPSENLDPLTLLREIVLALPEVAERESHGEPAWFVRKRLIASYADHHHDERVAVWCAAPPGVQEALIEENSHRFFRPPYVGARGWIGIDLDRPGELDWNEVAELLTDAYRMVAPKRLIEELDRHT